MVSASSKVGKAYVPAVIPASGRAISIVLSLVTISVIVGCVCWRLAGRQIWATIPLTKWLLYAIYVDSLLFVFVTAVIAQGLGLNDSLALCSTAVYMCLVFYMTTKMLYYFLVERARIVRGTSRKPRSQDKLYLFNALGMIIPYTVVIVLNLLYRFAHIDEKGMCIIGIKLIGVVPLVVFDVVYLTMLFLVPLCNLYSFKNNCNNALRKTALRATLGSCVTLASSVANLLAILILKGEPGWICLISCNSDVLFNVLVLHWMTAGDGDHQPRNSPPEATPYRPNAQARPPLPPVWSPPKIFDSARASDFPGNDSIFTHGSRSPVITSTIASVDETHQHCTGSGMNKDELVIRSSDERLGGIMRRTSLTQQSTREDSICSEKISKLTTA
ncbi:hypothetical protein EJ08DRAFT_596287 [Tothia fuscella]|uniref:Uncharacterized protein n=1 Tax=Tothia fuscella TaxID=1048955 RepID=A0A9P4NIT1_9PEZI|nr:hypothetical protein EJ08DRAFT_596287 [Tothia fuscella]